MLIAAMQFGGKPHGGFPSNAYWMVVKTLCAGNTEVKCEYTNPAGKSPPAHLPISSEEVVDALQLALTLQPGSFANCSASASAKANPHSIKGAEALQLLREKPSSCKLF